MTQNDVYDKIISVLVDEFEVEKDEVSLDSNLFTDLELDSLDAIDLMVTLDKEMGIETKTEEMKDIRTVQDVCDFVLSSASNNE